MYTHLAEATHFVIFLEPADRNKYLHASMHKGLSNMISAERTL